MSGPKPSAYELEEMRREQMRQRLEQQRRAAEEARRRAEEERLRRIEAERQQKVEAIGKLQGSMAGYKDRVQEVQNYLAYMKTIRPMDAESSMLEELLRDIIDATGPKATSTLDDATASLKKVESLKQKIDEAIAKAEAMKKAWIEESGEAIEQELKAIFEVKKVRRAPKSTLQSHEERKELVAAAKEIEKQEAIALKAEIDAFSGAGYPEVDKEISRIQKIVNNLFQLEDYYAVADKVKQMKPKLQTMLDDARAKEEELRNRYLDTMLAYETACKVGGIEIKDFTSLPINEDTIKLVDVERENVVELTACMEEKRIVRSEIEEVMAELGYSIIGTRDISRKRPDNTVNTISEIVLAGDDSSDGTVINVTMMDGQVVLETMAVDTVNRIPTEEESEFLEEEMENFCSEHAIILEKLAQRGVVLKRGNWQPPSRKLARVLNINDFDRVENAKFTTITEAKAKSDNQKLKAKKRDAARAKKQNTV